MPRPKKIRKITSAPGFKGFRPIGHSRRKNPVVMNFEEYEAIRLCDYELLSQLEASKVMEVSRPTFTRIYESARRKVAQAFAESKTIVFEGGKVYFDSDWFICKNCESIFNYPGQVDENLRCGLCNSSDITEYKIADIEEQTFHSEEYHTFKKQCEAHENSDNC